MRRFPRASVVQASRKRRVRGLLALSVLCVLAVAASLLWGARGIAPAVVLEALLGPDRQIADHVVVLDLRLPRTLVGIAAGAALGIAGVLMQAITRNPLADPGLLGVNAGASCAVVLAIWLFGLTGAQHLVWAAFLGASTVSVLVYLLGSAGRGSATPARLALAGAALSAILMSVVSMVLLIQQETLDMYRFWITGSLTGAQDLDLLGLAPFLAVGGAAGLAAAKSLNALALGDDNARALGERLYATRALTLLSVTMLCGASVAAAGPIGFIGLIVPHAARMICGPDQRWLIVYAALLGPVVLLLADVAGRVILPPGEVQAGIMTALVGGPLFVLIVRRLRLMQL